MGSAAFREATEGTRYKYHIVSKFNGYEVDKADPFAFHTEVPSQTASIVWSLDYDWQRCRVDGESRFGRQSLDAPMSIYEMHFGSWMRCPNARSGR